jgi:hypothetical protein
MNELDCVAGLESFFFVQAIDNLVNEVFGRRRKFDFRFGCRKLVQKSWLLTSK